MARATIGGSSQSRETVDWGMSSLCVALGFTEPPEDLVRALFPWAREQLALCDQRVSRDRSKYFDPTCRAFLDAVLKLRVVSSWKEARVGG